MTPTLLVGLGLVARAALACALVLAPWAIVTAVRDCVPWRGLRVRVVRGPERPWWWSTYVRRASSSPWERREATEYEAMPSSGKAWRVR